MPRRTSSLDWNYCRKAFKDKVGEHDRHVNGAEDIECGAEKACDCVDTKPNVLVASVSEYVKER